MNRFERVYYWAFFLSLVVCWGPWKALPYVLPLLLTLILILSHVQSLYRGIWLLYLLGTVIAFSSLLSTLMGREFIFQTAMLSLITYSAFFPLFVTPSRLLGKILYERMARLMAGFLIVEGAIGFVQILAEYLRRGSFDLNAGDVVEGTIDLALTNAVGFETKIFAMNVGLGLLLILPYLTRRWKAWRYPVSAGLFMIFLLSSVMHLTISFIVATISALLALQLLQGRRRLFLSLSLKIIGVVSLVLFIVWKTMPTNWVLISKMISMVPENPKIIVMSEILKQQPIEILFGVGPGQGISRASLTLTGQFLRGLDISQIPWLHPVEVPFYAKIEVLDLLYSPISRNSVLKPISSWIALLSEFGLLGTIILLLAVIVSLLRLRSHRGDYGEGRTLPLYCLLVPVLFLFLAGAFELYWEVPQSILPGLLLLKSLYAMLYNEK